MRWPLCRLIPKQLNIRYVRYAPAFGLLSAFLVILSFVSFATGGLRQSPMDVWRSSEDKLQAFACSAFNCGIDFKGGTLLEVTAPGTLDVGALRSRVIDLGLGDVNVQSFGTETSALIRFETPEGSNPAVVVDEVKAALREFIPSAEFPRVEVVGPKVSDELFTSGLRALGLAILLMLIYIWFRFEWQMGVGAVLGLFHDVILVLGMFSVLRIEFTLTIIAALLTIIGYSMNDTVVVFDRVRENLRKFKKKPLSDVVDLSLNETLSRTILTGVTTLGALLGLLVVGGEALFGFALATFVGVVIGTYSSIYVAAPAVLIWGVRRGGEQQPTEPGAAESPA